MRFVVAVSLVLSVCAAPSYPPEARAQAPAAPAASDDVRADVERIGRLFYAGQHAAVVREAGTLLARYGVTPATVSIVLFQAESRLQLGERGEAIRAYEQALPVVTKLNEVQRRGFAFVYFRLAVLARGGRQLDQAVTWVEAGLRLEPQNTVAQILLGELFHERGEKARALRHFQDLAGSSFPTSEERAVLAIKIDRLTTGRVGASLQPVDLHRAQLYDGISIGLVPLADLPKDVVLGDVCVALEAAWRITCDVLEPVALPDALVFVPERGQYDGDRVLDQLRRRMPPAAGPRRYILAVAGRDLFGAEAPFVFSWQIRGPDYGIGVMSAFRFAAASDGFYEKSAVTMRRVIIQAISTSGSMLGFDRPTNPVCPTAFPIDFRELQQKRARLCPSEEEERDALLKARGGAATNFGEPRLREIDRVYRAYYLE